MAQDCLKIVGELKKGWEYSLNLGGDIITRNAIAYVTAKSAEDTVRYFKNFDDLVLWIENDTTLEDLYIEIGNNPKEREEGEEKMMAHIALRKALIAYESENNQ